MARYTDIIKAQIGISDQQLNSIIGEAEFVLLRHFDSNECLWDTKNKELRELRIWNALWILKFGFALGYSSDSSIFSMYERAIDKLLSMLICLDDKSEAIPMKYGAPPDVGATSLLLEIMRFSPLKENRKYLKHIKKMASFLIKHGFNEKYLKYSFSWSRANVITSLLAKSPWGIEIKSTK